MRANRKMRAESKNEAQVGIGTMIVFIATVLVAAIAAGVLIQTSQKLQERSSKTGDQTTKQVASNLKIERVVGIRYAATDSNLDRLLVYFSLAPGAGKIDLKQVKLHVATATNLKTVSWASADNGPDADGFSINETRDADNSLCGSDATCTVTESMVMNSGDLAYLEVSLSEGGFNLALPVRTAVTLNVFPEVGSSTKGDFTTPESYGSETQIDLR